MATTGALGNYYVDSFLLGADAADELGAGRYAPGALGQPPRQAAALAEHPDFSPCSFQPKAAVFGASWNPVHAAGANAVPAAVYHHHHHHPYVHPQAPVAAAAPDVDREKQPSEGAFSENNPENESGGDKPPIDPSKCLLLPGRPPPPRRPPGSAGPPAFSGACLRLRWEPPEQRPGARSCCLGSPLGWGPPSPESSDKPARRASGEGRRRLPGEGAGQALRDDPRPGDPLLGLPGTKTEILWARFFESDAPEKAFCAARLSGSGGSNCSLGSLTRDAGEDGRFSPLLASARGGVNPAQDAAAGDRDARVPVLDYSNKLEK
ncbi:homeobox protein Hox-A9 isoform X1 [Muntiacus reevesi]|uniref:homeobox protein Hox-A9 isoform X1 n=1 Tax=Muntiacus reevesi TaxID=9886 RepID=UPI0033071D91